MKPVAAIRDSALTDARMLVPTEDVLMAMRRCKVDTAFREIVEASKRHQVPALIIARAGWADRRRVARQCGGRRGALRVGIAARQ